LATAGDVRDNWTPVADAVFAAPPEPSSATATLDDAGVARDRRIRIPFGRLRAVLDHLRVIGHAGPMLASVRTGPSRADARGRGALGAAGVFAG
jgi:hypothetical protein